METQLPRKSWQCMTTWKNTSSCPSHLYLDESNSFYPLAFQNVHHRIRVSTVISLRQSPHASRHRCKVQIGQGLVSLDWETQKEPTVGPWRSLTTRVVASVLACMVGLVAKCISRQQCGGVRVSGLFIHPRFFLLGRYQIDQLRCTLLRNGIVVAVVVVVAEKRR